MSADLKLARQRWLLRLLRAELGLTEQQPDVAELAAFQQTGLVAVESALSSWGGALLADEVGLGKTHVALAVLERRPRGLVVAPASLLGMWRRRLEEADLLSRTTLVSHTALALGNAAIPTDPAIIVVDEAHAFTNPQTRRYRALARLTLGAPVLLLTATPFGIRPADLLNLLRLFLPPGSCRPLLGTTLEAWLDRPGDETHADWPFLLRRIVIRRSRAFLRRHWPGGLLLPGRDGEMIRLTFPERVPVQLRYSYTSEARPDGLTPFIDATLALDDDVLGAPPGLLKTMLLLRLESSPDALDGSLARLEGYLERLLEATDADRWLTRRSWRQLFGGLGADVDRQQVFPFFFDVGDDDVASTKLPSSRDIADTLSQIHRLRARLIGLKDHDPKFEALRPFIADAVIPPQSRVLIFTRFIDTAQALFLRLALAFPALGIGMIHGSGARYTGQPGAGYADRQEVLDMFLLDDSAQRQTRLRVLVATDVLSEGLDIQSCGSVVSYDLPWNPRRLIQRFGRLDRLGRSHRVVQSVCIAPERDLEALLGVMARLTERLTQAAETLGDSHALSEWLLEEAAPPPEPTVLVVGPSPQDTSRLDAEFLMRSDLLSLTPSGALDDSQTQTPPGWRLSASPRSPAGTLFVFDLGVPSASLWWTFVPDAVGAPLRNDRTGLYPRLRGLLRRPAELAEAPPARALRIALTDALRQRQRLWSVTLQPMAHPPGSAPARLLRRLSSEVLPGLLDTATLKTRERILDLLSGSIPAGLIATIEEGLAGDLDLDGWLTLLEAHAPTYGQGEASWGYPTEPGDLELLGFICFGPPST